MPHWSASRFMVYDQCPAAFRTRYVDGVAIEQTEALCFGQAVHLGLEAHYNGQDGERAFRAAWSVAQTELIADGHQVRGQLTGVGLQLLDRVTGLGLKGIPERGFSLDTELVFGAPIIGAIDLWSDGVIYDFKTTRGAWSEARAQTELWQPLLYSWAALQETGDLPAFEYIVCNRVSGQVDRYRRTWDETAWAEQWARGYDRMRAISQAVASDKLECHGRHGACPECGERWSHEHVCDATTSRRIRL
jgi:hypothetical protein